MNGEKYSWEEAVCYIRTLPEYKDLIINSYLDEDSVQAADRYFRSEEWREILNVLRAAGVDKGSVLDLGAGNGIASYAFAKAGFGVITLEPDPGDTVGRGAIKKLVENTGININLIDSAGENIPLPDNSVDIVFARQVLHHASSLQAMCREIARVLKPQGVLLAIREHVISRENDLSAFLNSHPAHNLYGGEYAYTLKQYIDAISGSGLLVTIKYGPFDSVINYAPMTKQELRELLINRLARILPAPASKGLLKNKLIFKSLCKAASLATNAPGRLYSFLAKKNGT